MIETTLQTHRERHTNFYSHIDNYSDDLINKPDEENLSNKLIQGIR